MLWNKQLLLCHFEYFEIKQNVLAADKNQEKFSITSLMLYLILGQLLEGRT